jgi:uncharacterized protein (DUF1501 family)
MVQNRHPLSWDIFSVLPKSLRLFSPKSNRQIKSATIGSFDTYKNDLQFEKALLKNVPNCLKNYNPASPL